MKRGCLWAAGIGVLLAIPLALFVASLRTDISPVDDSDLVLPARNADPAQNPFPEIRSFELSDDSTDAVTRAWQMIQGEETMDESFVTNLISIEAGTLERFEGFARMSDWREDQELTIASEMPYLSNWIAIAKLKVIESRQLTRTDEIDAAIESGMSILWFAERLHHAEGGFVHQMAGAAIANLGIVEILQIVESGRLSPDQLGHLAEALSSLSFTPEIFAQAYVVEYRTITKVIDDLAEGKVHIGQLQGPGGDEQRPSRPPPTFYFKRNKTTKMLADAYRQFIAEAPMIRSEASGAPIADAQAMRENSGALYFSGNMVGRILFSIVVPAGSQLNDIQAAMRASLDLLRIRVAMERYRTEKGAWPDDLNSLVPGFIDEIPRDPMDGQAMRYLRDKRVIYSVGVDFEDAGGVAPRKTGSLKSRKEIVINLGTPGESQ